MAIEDTMTRDEQIQMMDECLVDASKLVTDIRFSEITQVAIAFFQYRAGQHMANKGDYHMGQELSSKDAGKVITIDKETILEDLKSYTEAGGAKPCVLKAATNLRIQVDYNYGDGTVLISNIAFRLEYDDSMLPGQYIIQAAKQQD